MSQRIVDIATENALTDQYLRINNLEIVGLPELGDGETAEDEEVILIEALNSMNLPKPVTSNDIDISHMIQSNRKDNKRVHICKFKSRKKKHGSASKKKTIIISSSAIILFLLMNRHLFELAREKKNVLNYKFLWTKNGYVYLCRNEQSQVYKILDESIFNSLSTTME